MEQQQQQQQHKREESFEEERMEMLSREFERFSLSVMESGR